MRFSVLTILMATGYVALVLAAVRPPDSWWRHAATVAWLAVVAYLFVLAADPLKRPRATFGRVALGCIAAYLALAFMPSMPGDLLPHQWFATWWAPEMSAGYTMTTVVQPSYQPSFPPVGATYAPPNPNGPFVGGGFGGSVSQLVLAPTVPDYSSQVIGTVAALNAALLFGLLGGMLAAWGYRRAGRTETHVPVAVKPPTENAASAN